MVHLPDFPVVEYYSKNIIDGETISKGGGWWTAVLLIKDPHTEKPFIGLYRWQLTESGWKVRKKFSFGDKVMLDVTLKAIARLAAKIPSV